MLGKRLENHHHKNTGGQYSCIAFPGWFEPSIGLNCLFGTLPNKTHGQKNSVAPLFFGACAGFRFVREWPLYLFQYATPCRSPDENQSQRTPKTRSLGGKCRCLHKKNPISSFPRKEIGGDGVANHERGGTAWGKKESARGTLFGKPQIDIFG